MPARRHPSLRSIDSSLFPVKPRKVVPHAFVLDALAPLEPVTRPLFGCLAIYIGEKITLVLRDKPGQTEDNGVWLATTEEHHPSLRREFPNLRSIKVLGKKTTSWQVLPATAADFEAAALRACDLVLASDPRIGKLPGARPAKTTGQKRMGGTRKAKDERLA